MDICPQWLYPDRPQWGQEGNCYKPIEAVENEFKDLRLLLTEALRVAPAEATNSGEDESWQVTEEDVQSARFIKPKFLPGVILAQLTREIAKDDTKEVWTALFPLSRMRTEYTRREASTSRHRSCTD